MYGQGGYGGGGGWNPWGSGVGAGNNSNFQGPFNAQAAQQQQMRSGAMGQGGGSTGQMGQYQQQGANMMGFGGMGAGNNSMMGMMGYGGAMGGSANMMGLGGNVTPQSLMGMNDANANVFGMAAANPNANAMGMNMGMGNYVSNPFAQQQNQYLQQQQQQNSNQSIYQTQTSFPRPQPPLPPGPPPKDQPSRDTSIQPLFNNSTPQGVPPPLPFDNNLSGNRMGTTPPPPPPSDFSSSKKDTNQPPPPPPVESNSDPQIPEQVLKLLKNAETARQFQQAAEALAHLSPLMKINVSQELFGIKSGDSKKGGIPGLDFGESTSKPDAQRSDFVEEFGNKKQDKDASEKSEKIDRGNTDNMRSTFGDRKLDQKPSASWNEGRKTWRDYQKPKFDNQQDLQMQSQNKSDNTEKKQPEIKWELRSDIEKLEEKSKEVGIPEKPVNKEHVSTPKTDSTIEKSLKETETHVEVKSTETQPKSNGEEKADATSTKPVATAGSDAGSGVSSTVSATIPLGSGDGKPVSYDRKTLKVFDKKFREWEKQFENWKMSNQNHPDQDAYKKFMDQWNLWRQQLIEQRRFILDSMNKARLEGNELAMQKTLSNETAEDFQKSKAANEKQDSTDKNGAANFGRPPGPPPATHKPDEKLPPSKPSGGNSAQDSSISARLASLASNQSLLGPGPGERGVSGFGGNTNFQNQQPLDKNVPMGMKSGPGPGNRDVSGFGGNTNFQNQKTSDNKMTMGTGPKKAPPPPPLMSVSVEPETASNNRFESANDSSKPRSDRVVERIPRDRDRPFVPPKFDTIKGKEDSSQRRSNNTEERIARDPHPQQEIDPFGQDPFGQDPWAINNRPDKNPFEEAEKMQNPFMQAQNQNSFGWGAKEDNLPKLSDFLQRDDFSMSTQVLRTSVIPNQNTFSSGGNAFAKDMQRSQQSSRLQGVSFEPNSKGMPLLTVSKRQPTPEPPKELNPPATTDLSQWFTRDRRGGFEEDDVNEESQDYYDERPAVIDYGHGSGGATNEEDEYDLPRCEREQQSYDDYEEEDNEQTDVVTIDYGHGSGSGNIDSTRGFSHEEEQGDYYEEEYYDEYADNYGYSAMNSRGRGMPMPQRGRGGIRGRIPDGRFSGAPQQSRLPLQPAGGQSYGYPPQMRPTLPSAPRGLNPDSRGAFSRPVANRGLGRGGPVRFPVSEPIMPGEIGRPLLPTPKPRQDIDLTEMERVESPEIMILSPPRDSKGPRRAPPREDDRVPRDFERSDRDSRRRDQSRDSEDRYRSSRRDNSRDREDRSRSGSGRYARDDDRRVRRDPSPSRRDRERDRDSRDPYGRTKRRSRSRSRSPTFDRVAVYRNPLGPPAGSGNLGMHSVNPPPPRYQTVLIEDILNRPGRTKRPSHIVIILRGLPGSGKTHVAKLIKDREVEMGGSAPRILSLDDYFMVEKSVKDPATGAETKETILEYEYEADLEPKYRSDLTKTFKKTVENGFFDFIVVDGVNDHVRHFEDMVTYATQRRFQVYIAEVEEKVETCVKRNVHHRTKDQIQKIYKNWERTPSNYVKLDVRTLLQDEAIQDVEMEDVSDTENVEDGTDKISEASDAWEKEDEEVNEVNTDDSQMPAKSKWETIEPSEEKLKRLDGLTKKKRTDDEDDKVDSNLTTSIDSWLQSHLPEDYTSRQQTRPGQKRVRWADIEERRAQERMRDVGFVVGHTDWNRMTDPTFGGSALTKTKYI